MMYNENLERLKKAGDIISYSHRQVKNNCMSTGVEDQWILVFPSGHTLTIHAGPGLDFSSGG